MTYILYHEICYNFLDISGRIQSFSPYNSNKYIIKRKREDRNREIDFRQLIDSREQQGGWRDMRVLLADRKSIGSPIRQILSVAQAYPIKSKTKTKCGKPRDLRAPPR